MLRMSTGTCAEHTVSTGVSGCDVECVGGPEWSSMTSACPPTPQEPELDPKPILGAAPGEAGPEASG